jgi:hypothetical protein
MSTREMGILGGPQNFWHFFQPNVALCMWTAELEGG